MTGFFDSRLTNTAAGDLRGAIISGSRAIVFATDDAIVCPHLVYLADSMSFPISSPTG